MTADFRINNLDQARRLAVQQQSRIDSLRAHVLRLKKERENYLGSKRVTQALMSYLSSRYCVADEALGDEVKALISAVLEGES